MRKVRGYRLNENTAESFDRYCEVKGHSQIEVIEAMMYAYIKMTDKEQDQLKAQYSQWLEKGEQLMVTAVPVVQTVPETLGNPKPKPLDVGAITKKGEARLGRRSNNPPDRR